MGGRGSQSASSQQMATSPAGAFPKSMEQLVGDDGHISLKPGDYDGYSMEQVEAFLASQPYEVHVVFSPDGKPIMMTSKWSDAESPMSIDFTSDIIKKRGDNGNGYTNFHNHPNPYGTLTTQLFSPTDIDAYVLSIASKNNWLNSKMLPDRYSVRSFDGHRFELRYVGGGDLKGFKLAYKKAMNKAKKQRDEFRDSLGLDGIMKYYSPTDGYKALDAAEMGVVTSYMDGWLRSNAGKYGFAYTSTWKG